jgi:spermidine/putrescine transport system substrate-binding protein
MITPRSSQHASQPTSQPQSQPHSQPAGHLSRRRLLGAGAAAGLSLPLLPALTGCGISSKPRSAAQDLSGVEQTLAVSNWTYYIDVQKGDKSVHPTLEAFEQEHDLSVTYSEDISDNEEFFLKLRPVLAAGKSTQRDIVVLTDWMAAKMIELDYVESIDDSNIPNKRNLIPSLQSPPFDPERNYSLPWQSGFTAIGYNSDFVDTPVTSMTELLTRPDLKGKVAVFTEMRDTTGLIMLDQGADPSNFTDDDFDNAIAMLQEAVDSGHLRTFANANYGQALSKGDLVATMTYSGDINQFRLDNPALELVKPEAGFVLWSDNMLIPRGSTHKTNAELWMNWYYDPATAAKLAAYVNFICPVQGAQQEMKKLDKSLAGNPLIFPSEEDLDGGSFFRSLTSEEDQRYTAAFTQVRGL